MIKRLELKNFTAFRNLSIDFSPKISVIVGENGTGKTHVLKAAYCLCMDSSHTNQIPNNAHNTFEEALTAKILRLFMPLDNRLSKIRHNGTKGKSQLKADFHLDTTLSLFFSGNSKAVTMQNNAKNIKHNGEPVFIPTKEVLSLMKGISSKNADQQTIRSIFDDTYLDLCQALLKPAGQTNSDQIDLDPRFGTVFPKMVNAIGGRFDFHMGNISFQQGSYEQKRVSDQHKYGDKTKTVFKTLQGHRLSNNMTAEGFKKIGELQQLLQNQSLQPGISGPLFWDEPECNMNPKLMSLLVEILLELSRNGQQIVIATHDYVLLKWFDLLMDKDKEDHVLFHSLYRDDNTREIKINTTDDYLNIIPNPIDEAFGTLINQEITNDMGELGK